MQEVYRNFRPEPLPGGHYDGLELGAHLLCIRRSHVHLLEHLLSRGSIPCLEGRKSMPVSLRLQVASLGRWPQPIRRAKRTYLFIYANRFAPRDFTPGLNVSSLNGEKPREENFTSATFSLMSSRVESATQVGWLLLL